jgi:formylmethanofuran dehydrogenase subunit E
MAPAASAQDLTPQQWISHGERVHGGFGTFIAVGIRIGLDALRQLEARPREVAVELWSGPKSPCPCAIDGIIVATSASPGQGTAKVADARAPEGSMFVAVFTHRKTGASVRYTVGEKWLAQLAAWNKQFDPAGRFDVVMKADGLFETVLQRK